MILLIAGLFLIALGRFSGGVLAVAGVLGFSGAASFGVPADKD